jgi:hypothetical protein
MQMLRMPLVAALLLGAASPAFAQGGPPSRPYAPLQDRPTCSRDELKAATAARDYLVDEGLGVVNVNCRFGTSTSGMPDSHTFRYIDGKMRNVHTLSVNPGSTPSPQADDNGAMVRTQS